MSAGSAGSGEVEVREMKITYLRKRFAAALCPYVAVTIIGAATALPAGAGSKGEDGDRQKI